MGGGLMQLVAYGAQDVYLTGNPQITFFKVVYRRHTNFAVECIEQTFNGTADFGRTVTCNIARNGDLITKMYLKIDLEETTDENAAPYGFCENLGHAVIESCKIEIGGSKIDEQYGDWLNIWEELAGKHAHQRGLNAMIGNVTELRSLTETKDRYSMYVPMKFWFCRNNGLALPLIALQYHDVRVTFKFHDANRMVNVVAGKSRSDIKFKDATLLIDYVYLDSEERKRFAQASHEYLIEQLQYTGEESVNTANDRFRLNFNHPCKALYWALKLGKYNSGHHVLCLDDDGNINKDKFAKTVWACSRAGLIKDPAKKDKEEFLIDLTGNDENEIQTLVKELSTTSSNSKTLLEEILGKIDAQIVTVVGDQDLKASTLHSNIVLTKNDLTMDLISRGTCEALTDGLSTQLQKNALKAASCSYIKHNNYGLYVDGSVNPVLTGKLQLNGHDRFATRSGNYFNYVQPYEHFTNTPADGINVYSFALNPEEHQPSGSCNMSRIDNATLLLNLGTNSQSNGNFATEFLNDNTVIQIYTVNYNVLRIMSGMGGLAYSN
jgi:hypothetical protein